MIPLASKQIPTCDIPNMPEWANIRILDYQNDPIVQQAFGANKYQFLNEHGKYTSLRGTLSRKGARANSRITLMLHPTIREFTEVVRYNPAAPPTDDYGAREMLEAHQQAQSDFKNAKAANALDFSRYILEAQEGVRTAYLPVISGWIGTKATSEVVFVIFDRSIPDALYGMAFIPKGPVMQSDGQTQTAAIFKAAGSAEAQNSDLLDTFRVSIEIELGISEDQARQSFADRNGRGTKKNPNLVIAFDTSAPLTRLINLSAKDTVFEHRLANGRNTSTSRTATEYIVDLSTMEQMLLMVISGRNSIKPEQFRHHHLDTVMPYAKEFLMMLDHTFAEYWSAKTSPNNNPYRELYIHAWPFALKAFALAYHQARYKELSPIASAIIRDIRGDGNPKLQKKERFQDLIDEETNKATSGSISFDELKTRLKQIDWLRYRKHWIDITGYAKDKHGKPKAFRLKSTGEPKVQAYAQNQKVITDTVTSAILSKEWIRLTNHEDFSLN